MRLRAVLTEDAADGGDFVSLRVESMALAVNGVLVPAAGGVGLSVNGASGRDWIRDWSARADDRSAGLIPASNPVSGRWSW